jgi:hypothetical protein
MSRGGSKEGALDLGAIRAAVGSLPEASQREAAGKNVLLVELAAGGDERGKAMTARTARSLHVEALDALLRGRMAEIGVARDWELLREVARLAHQDAPIALATTDPALYSTWRAAVTKYHLKGWTNMTPERVDAVRAQPRASRLRGSRSSAPARLQA